MGYDLGTVKGSISIDIAQAVAAYAALRRTNAATDTALLESSRSLKTVGAGLAGIGAIALAGFAVAVKAAADFQNQMRYFQVITGSSKADMKAATDEAFKLARTSGYTANEIAGAFVELGKAGINAKQIVAGVGDAVGQLGAAAQIPLKDASEIIVNTMKTFQLGAGQATDIANQLAGAANASTVDISDLAYSLKYVGGTAHALNVPLHDVLDALGQLGNAGIRGSTGGTALRKILLQLAPTTRQAVDELEKLGIIQTNGGLSATDYAKAQGKQKTAIDELRKAQQRLIEVQRVQAAEGVAGSTSSTSRAASAKAEALAQERLAAAQDHLNATQQKYSAAGSLAKNAQSQATMFDQLASAQHRVREAEIELQKVQSGGSSGTTATSAAKQIRAQYALKNAQDAVTAAAQKARAVGVQLAPGVEKLTNLFFTQAGKAKPLSEIFQILQDHMKGLTQQQKVQAAELIFGNRAISSALILTRQGAKGFQEFGKQMDQTTAADVMRKRLDTLSGAWKKFKGSMSVALIQAGAPAQTPLKILVNFLTSLVNIFTRMPSSLQTAISAFVLLFGVITGGLGAFILMVGFIGKAVRAYREFKMALMFVKEIQLVQRAFALLNLTMLANPVILIVAAVIALIAILAILIIKVKPVREFFKTLGTAILGAFEAVVRFVKRIPQYFEDAWNGIKHGVSALLGWLKKNWDIVLALLVPGVALLVVWKRFHTQILNVVKTIVRDVVTFFADLPRNLARIFVAGGTAVLKFLSSLPDQVAYWLAYVIGRVLRWEIQFTALLIKAGVDAVTGILHWFEQLPGRLWSILTTITRDEIRGWENINRAIIHWAGAAFHAVINFFEKLPGRMWNFLVETEKRTIQGWKNIYHAMINWAKQAFDDVVNFFKQLPGNIKTLLTTAWNDIVNVGKSIIKAMSDIGLNALNGIIGFFQDLPTMIYNALVSAIKSIGSLAGKAFDAAKHWGGSLWNGFKHGLGIHSPSYIEKALKAITDTGDSETKKLAGQVKYINGLANTLPPANKLLAYSASSASRGAVQRASGAGTDGGTHSKHIEVNNYYPTPEKSSEAVPRVLRNLDFVGAL